MDIATNDHDTHRWWTLLAVCGGTFMLLIDITIVQVALPTIQHHLHANFADLQWTIDAYALALASLILTFGSMADRFGRRQVFLFGVAVFTAASLLCATSTDATFLIWSRALQGIGGGAMFATGLALIGQEFHGPERGRALAIWGATVGGAVAVGPLVGGVLTSGLGWQWIFFVNVPVGLVTIWIARSKTANVKDPASMRLDLGGLVTFSGSIFLLVFALIRESDDGWTSSTIVSLLACSAALLLAFIVVELRQERAMFDLSLFRNKGFTSVSVATFATGAGMFAMFPYLTLYLQNDLGFSPLQGGLRLLPATVPCFVVPLLIRGIAEKLAPGLVLGVGLAVCAGGLGATATLSAHSSWVALIPGFVLIGLGIGIANPALARIALGVVEPQRAGMASGLSNTFRIGGLATGVAALGTIFQQKVTSTLQASLGHPASELAKTLTAAGLRSLPRGSNSHRYVAASQTAFVSGLRLVLIIGLVAVAIGAVIVTVFVRASDFVRTPRPSEPDPSDLSDVLREASIA